MSMPRPSAGARSHASALALLSLLCVIAIEVIFMVAVHTEDGQRLDDAGRGNTSLADAPRAFSATERLLETISVSSLALFGLGIMGIALLRRRPGLAVGAGVIVLGSNVSTQIMKETFARPDLVGGAIASPGAFPSGHVTVAMSLAMALVLVVPPALRWAAALVGCAYAIGVGAAVLALDWHRPSEVIGAYLMAVAWAAAVAAALILLGAGAAGIGEPAPGGGRLGALVAGGLALAFALVVGVSAARRLDVVRIVDDRTVFFAAVAVAGATCAALGATVAVLLQRAQMSPTRPADR